MRPQNPAHFSWIRSSGSTIGHHLSSLGLTSPIDTNNGCMLKFSGLFRKDHLLPTTTWIDTDRVQAQQPCSSSPECSVAWLFRRIVSLDSGTCQMFLRLILVMAQLSITLARVLSGCGIVHGHLCTTDSLW